MFNLSKKDLNSVEMWEVYIWLCVLARSYIVTSVKVNLWLKTAQSTIYYSVADFNKDTAQMADPICIICDSVKFLCSIQ